MRVFLLSLLALTVFGSVDYAVLRANHNDRMTEAALKLQSMHDEVKASMKSFELQSASDDCNSARAVFFAVWSSNNCSVVSEVWSNETTEARSAEIYQTYCVAKDAQQYTCKAKVDWAFLQYLKNCTAAGQINATQLEQQRYLLTLSDIACLTDDTDQHPCSNDLRALMNLGQNYTQEKLDKVCTACIKKVFTAFDRFATKDLLKISTYLSLLCFKLNGDYCSLKFINAIGGVGPVGDKGPSDDQLKQICQPCIAAFISRHLTTVTALGGNLLSLVEETKFLKLIRVMCITNMKGEFCFTKLTNDEANTTFTNLGVACLGGVGKWVLGAQNTCTPTCHEQLENANAKFGCCFGTWFNLLEWQKIAKPDEYKLPYGPDVLQAYIRTQCGSTVPIGCAAQKVAVSIVLKNVAWQWYLDHQASSDKDLKAYVMWLLGLDEPSVSNVTVTQVGGTTVGSSASKYQLLANDNTGSIQVDTVVYPQTQADVDVVSANAKAATTQSNPISASWELSARSDPSQGISAASADAKPVGGGAFATNTPAYYLATFIVAIVTLLLV
jgi:hypothetical protein